MFVTHFHLLALLAQVIKIFSTIKWPQSGWKGPDFPDFNELWKLERMGQSLETSLLSRPELLPIYEAIRATFRDLESGNPQRRSHENLRINLRKVRDEISKVLAGMPRLPVRPLGMVEQADLDRFDRPYP